MADVTSKVKMFLFLAFISLLINVSIAIFKEPFDLSSVLVMGVTAFIPFADVIGVAFLNLPVEMMAIMLIITGIMSALKIFYLAIMVINILPTFNV